MSAGPDWQTVGNWAAAAFLAATGWLLKAMHGEIEAVKAELKDARRDHADMLKGLPETYARRDDVRDGFKEMRETLLRIEEKLDDKVDA